MAEHQTQQDNPVTLNTTDDAIVEVLSISNDLFTQGQMLLETLFRTWNLYQLLIAAAVFVVAHLLRAVLGPCIRAWKA